MSKPGLWFRFSIPPVESEEEKINDVIQLPWDDWALRLRHQLTLSPGKAVVLPLAELESDERMRLVTAECLRVTATSPPGPPVPIHHLVCHGPQLREINFPAGALNVRDCNSPQHRRDITFPSLPWESVVITGTHHSGVSFLNPDLFPKLQRVTFSDFFIARPEVSNQWFLYLSQMAFTGKTIPVFCFWAHTSFVPRGLEYLCLFQGCVSKSLSIRDFNDGNMDLDLSLMPNYMKNVDLSHWENIWLDSAVATNLLVLVAGHPQYSKKTLSVRDVVLTLDGWHNSCSDAKQRQVTLEGYLDFLERLFSRIYIRKPPMPVMTWRCPLQQSKFNERCFEAWLKVLIPPESSGPVELKLEVKKPYVHRLNITPRRSLPLDPTARATWFHEWVRLFRKLVKRLGPLHWHLRHLSMPELSAESFVILYNENIPVFSFFLAYQEHYTLLTPHSNPRQVFPNNIPFIKDQYNFMSLV